jgi:hypothetical protein
VVGASTPSFSGIGKCRKTTCRNGVRMRSRDRISAAALRAALGNDLGYPDGLPVGDLFGY